MLGTHNLPKQAYTTSAISFGRKTLPSRGTRRSTSCCGVRTALGKACKFRTVGRSTRHVRCLSKAGEEFPIRPKKRSDWELGPAFDLSQEQAVCMQLKALQQNDLPTADHGIEVLYRFADFDPFARSCYFGVNRDLGQFERFRRIFHTPHYSVLLSHLHYTPLSSLQVSELQWKHRVWVKGYKGSEEGVFEFFMVKRLGGRYDGTWFTRQLTCDGYPGGTLSV
ncbi:TPA: hypothetical protein ACH3X2_011077 [Trebouxia sp. C0005]